MTANKATAIVRAVRRSVSGDQSTSQQDLIRGVKRVLGNLTTDDLGNALEVSPHTIQAWLAPDDNAKHREMPYGMRTLLDAIIKHPQYSGIPRKRKPRPRRKRR